MKHLPDFKFPSLASNEIFMEMSLASGPEDIFGISGKWPKDWYKDPIAAWDHYLIPSMTQILQEATYRAHAKEAGSCDCSLCTGMERFPRPEFPRHAA